MIFRLLLLFLIVWFLIWIVKKQISDSNQSRPNLKNPQSEDMIACSYCGTHVPKSLGVELDGKFYCCQEHSEIDSNQSE